MIAVSDPDLVKHRAHLELRTASTAQRTELIARLTGLGATPVDPGRSTVAVTVFSDPEGNQFCVLQPSEADGDTGPIAAVAVDCADPQNLARFYTAAMDVGGSRRPRGQRVLRPRCGLTGNKAGPRMLGR